MDLANHLVYNGRLRCGAADVAAARLDVEFDAGALAGMPAWLQRVRAGRGRMPAMLGLCIRRLGAVQGPYCSHACCLAPWRPSACRRRPLSPRAAAAAEYTTARSPPARAWCAGAGAGGGRAVPGPAGARRGRAAGRRLAVQPGRGGRGVPAGGRAGAGRRAAGRRRRHLALPLPGAARGQGQGARINTWPVQICGARAHMERSPAVPDHAGARVQPGAGPAQRRAGRAE